ncbi:hypothetical protein [Pseudomonas sp. DR48]|uniref:hypothetical protein n=1 Tax=Pseudomonas sp. DR48 TaxID=2871095 RepID=UPI001C991E9A|nr:hypothetical protein [Pseudomonas sp. DR48]QZP30718.1 hypothetical protein K5K95_21270 [Pseudomonas sp. DR48]
MPYPKLKHAIQRAGFTITEFSDQRAFFGCWSLTVEGDGHSYLIVNEGREGWMMFYLKETGGEFIELDKKESTGMDDADRAIQCLIWLFGSCPLQECKVRNT